MTLKLDRRALLQTGLAAAGVAASAGPGVAENATPKLTTHALDTYLGKKAAGLRIDFSRKDGNAWTLLKTVATDQDGHVDSRDPLMSGDSMAVGRYELLFHVEDYYRRLGVTLTDPSFLDTVPVRFAIIDAKQTYHIPLYFTPWSVFSYRGT